MHSITGAVSPHSDDFDARIRRYLISMSIRVLCVVLAIFVHAQWRHWSWWIFAVGAVILPYVAVVMANSVDRRRGGAGPAPVTPQFILPSHPAPSASEPMSGTIHAPEERIGPESPDSPVSGQSFDPDHERFVANARSSSEQSK